MLVGKMSFLVILLSSKEHGLSVQIKAPSLAVVPPWERKVKIAIFISQKVLRIIHSFVYIQYTGNCSFHLLFHFPVDFDIMTLSSLIPTPLQLLAFTFHFLKIGCRVLRAGPSFTDLCE